MSCLHQGNVKQDHMLSIVQFKVSNGRTFIRFLATRPGTSTKEFLVRNQGTLHERPTDNSKKIGAVVVENDSAAPLLHWRYSHSAYTSTGWVRVAAVSYWCGMWDLSNKIFPNHWSRSSWRAKQFDPCTTDERYVVMACHGFCSFSNCDRSFLDVTILQFSEVPTQPRKRRRGDAMFPNNDVMDDTHPSFQFIYLGMVRFLPRHELVTSIHDFFEGIQRGLHFGTQFKKACFDPLAFGVRRLVAR